MNELQNRLRRAKHICNCIILEHQRVRMLILFKKIVLANIVGIEIKNSGTVNSHDFKELRYLRVKYSFTKGIVQYTGSQYATFSVKLYAIHINQSLWETK